MRGDSPSCWYSKSEFMPASSSPSHAVARRRWPRWVGWSGAVLVLLAAVALAAGPVARMIINRQLATLEDHEAKIGAVRVAWWRAGVEVRDFVLRERDKPDEPPLVEVGLARFQIDVRPLFRGRFGGSGLVEDVEVFFAKHHVFAGPVDAAERAAGEVQASEVAAGRWQRSLARALPFEIRRFELRRARVRYVDRARQPDVGAEIRDLHAVLTGLHNRPESDAELPARAEVRGVTTGGGRLHVTVRANPAAPAPRFQLTFELKDLSLPAFNPFLRAYLGADVSRGTFEVYSEITAADGAYEGYVKPFFHDLDFENVGDAKKGVLARAKEAVVDAVASVLESREEKVATVTPFSGTLAKAEVDVWETVHQLLRNAFIEALREGLGAPD